LEENSEKRVYPVEYFVTEDWDNEAEDTISIQKKLNSPHGTAVIASYYCISGINVTN